MPLKLVIVVSDERVISVVGCGARGQPRSELACHHDPVRLCVSIREWFRHLGGEAHASSPFISLQNFTEVFFIQKYLCLDDLGATSQHYYWPKTPEPVP